ncbi:MAG: hypothetical protein V4660_18055 [Pseudomonadota bacterium]
MHYIKLTIIVTVLAILGGCASIDCKPDKLRTGYALPGTNTVVIGVSLDKNGIPKESFKDIVLYPGQTALFAGPDEFAIVFKNKKTPNGRVENKSAGGTVAIKIPEGILEQAEFVEEFRKNDSLTFDYAIRVNGRELDPPMIIKREN